MDPNLREAIKILDQNNIKYRVEHGFIHIETVTSMDMQGERTILTTQGKTVSLPNVHLNIESATTITM